MDLTFSPKSLSFFLVRLLCSRNLPLSPISESETIVNGFVRDASFGPPLSAHIWYLRREFFWKWTVRELKLSLMLSFLFLTHAGSFTSVPQPTFRSQNTNICWTGLWKMPVLAYLKFLKVCFTGKILLNSFICSSKIQVHAILSFSAHLPAFIDMSHSFFRSRNHKLYYISCVDISVIKPWLKMVPVKWYDIISLQWNDIISLHGLNCPIK